MTWTILADGRAVIDKDPDASLRYGVNVADVIAEGDTVAGASIAEQSGVTAASASYSGTVVSCRVSGGTAGQTGSVTLRWTTVGGDTDDRTLYFRVRER